VGKGGVDVIDIGIDKPGHSTRLLIQQALGLYAPQVLVQFLRDKDSIVRTAAARELQQRGAQIAFDEAKSLISSKRAIDREIGAFLLGQIGIPMRLYKEESSPLLIGLLSDKSAIVRAAAASSLGHLLASDAVLDLINAGYDSVPKVRSAVAFALSKFPSNEHAERCLLRLSEDEDSDVRLWAKNK
jgi:HEAT repeat protein